MKALLLAVLLAPTVFAQLPVARLNTIYPPGAEIGVPIEVVANGADLDDARELRFSDLGISATLKEGTRFTVTAGTNVSPGIYEARVIGRFGASNPRAFVIGDRTEAQNASTNRAAASAMSIALGNVINGRSTPNAADFFRFKAAKDQSLILECEARRIDSRMEPVFVVFDSAGKELSRARFGGLLEFVAPADGEFVIKLHDSQFRGGDEFWYRLAVHDGPWIDYALPAAAESGKSKMTLFGRNFPNGSAQMEVEIEAPAESKTSNLATRPADAGVDAFEYRMPGSNPILIGHATAKPVVEIESTNTMRLEIPCEVSGQFFPKGDVDAFEFETAKGDVFWIEVFSQRLGQNTDPFLVVQRVTKNDKGEEKSSDVQDVYDNDANAGGAEFNTATRDPAYRLEAKDGGLYRVRIRDLFASQISDPRRIYRLSIHKEAPDFRLIACAPAPPPLNKDLKEAATFGTFLRRGDTIPIRVLALRKDGFNGDIELAAENLPAGVAAAPARIKSGANEGTLMLSAAEDASGWTGPLRIVGKAKDISHVARAGAIAWSVGDYNNDPVQSHLTQELILNVSGAEVAPLAILSEQPIEGVAGGKVIIPLTIVRRHEFNNGVKFRAFIDPIKEFEVDGKATNATFELELKKLEPGMHWFPVLATSPGRYRRITIAEAKSMEEEIKKLKDSLSAITEEPKKKSINDQVKNLEERLKYRDMTATVYTSFGVNIAPAPQKAP